MRNFLACPSGRVASATFSWLLLLAALLALDGKSGIYLYVMPWAVILGSVGFIASVAFAIDEHPFGAMMQVILLPFCGGVYYAGLHVVMDGGMIPAVVLTSLAAWSAWIAAVGYRRWA